MVTRSPASAPESERGILGAVLLNPRALGALGDLRPTDFWDPRNELVFRTVLGLARDGHPYDPQAVLAALSADEIRRLGGGPYLHDLISSPVHDPGYHSSVILNRSHQRSLQELAVRFETEAWRSGSGPELQEWIEREVGKVGRHVGGEEFTLMTAEEFLSKQLEDVEFVMPGVLGRGERLVITGGEGGGKSMLLRQIALAAAAGIDPFGRGAKYEPRKSLIIDLENPDRIIHKTLRMINVAVRQMSGRDPLRTTTIDRKRTGIDVSNPRDRSWLARSIEAAQPDVLAIGPLYKIRGRSRFNDAEEMGAQVAEFLDEMIAISDAVLVTEAHAPLSPPGARFRPLRPIGTSLWLRWPEFGYGLQRDERSDQHRRVVKWENWRGDRDERDWPEVLESGGPLPWTEGIPA